MLDIAFIRNNTDVVKEAVTAKNLALDVDALLVKDGERIALLQEMEELQSLKNDINDLIQKAGTPEERTEIIAKGKEIKAKIDELEPRFTAVKSEFEVLMAQVPNIISPDTPRGKSDAENTPCHGRHALCYPENGREGICSDDPTDPGQRISALWEWLLQGARI